MQRKKSKIDKTRIIEHVMAMTFGGLVMVLLFSTFFFSFNPNIFRTFVDMDRTASYVDDDYVKSISMLCDLHDDELDKFICVQEFYEDVFDYNYTRGVKSPSEMFKTGGDCLDSVYFFCSVFSTFDGYECQVVNLNNVNHAIAVVTFDNKYCLVDQEYYQCVLVGGGEDIIEQKS